NYAHLGHHESGYTSFIYDLTDYVRLGDRTPNGLRVRVDGRRHEQDMYEGTGIYRHVWLLITNRLHAAWCGVFINTPRVSRTAATVLVQTRIQNENPTATKCRLVTRLIDADGRVKAEVESQRTLPAGGEYTFEQQADLSQPHLWDIDDPYLYRAHTLVYDGAKIVDAVETLFGVRTFAFTADNGFFLNGRPVKLRGFNAHYDFAGVGTALPDRMQWDAMMVMKQAGFNFYRSSHNPPTPERLEVCDRIGLLVWDEIERKLESPEVELALVRETILRDRNHPSVILWSLENESPLESTVFGTKIIEQATALAHELDPTRLTTSAASMPVNRNGYGGALDVVSYNYDWRRADQDHLDFPHWKIGLLSEYAAARARRGVYGVERFGRAEEDSYFDLYSGQVETMYELCSRVEGYWRRIKARAYMAGGCVWSGKDSWGEGNAWPLISRGDGVLDLCLFPKDAFYYFVSQWAEKPMVHLFPHWNWPGSEGQTIDVWCYSNCDSVELFLNDRPFGFQRRPAEPAAWLPGRQAPSPEQAEERAEHLAWEVPYQPGVLRAVGMRNGAMVCEQRVSTAAEPAAIKLSPLLAGLVDEKQISPLVADGRDVAILKAEIVDRNGVRVPQAGNLVHFTVEGAEKIIGVGNGDMASHEANQAAFRKAYNGLCAVIVQTTKTPGRFSVVATSPGLISDRFNLCSQAPQPASLHLHAPSARLRSSGELVVTVELCDAYGVLAPSADRPVQVTVRGPATVTDQVKTATIQTVQGKATVALTPTGSPGLVTVLAAAEGLIPSCLTVTVTP
ncbi:glycoside hydrolase family 2 protein, partial [bacterium]|nr:glycoside hydrolase family 2 protein [bacterium]